MLYDRTIKQIRVLSIVRVQRADRRGPPLLVSIISYYSTLWSWFMGALRAMINRYTEYERKGE